MLTFHRTTQKLFYPTGHWNTIILSPKYLALNHVPDVLRERRCRSSAGFMSRFQVSILVYLCYCNKIPDWMVLTTEIVLEAGHMSTSKVLICLCTFQKPLFELTFHGLPPVCISLVFLCVFRFSLHMIIVRMY